MPETPRVPRCRVCECTDNDACLGGCSWAEADLCSTCYAIREHLCTYFIEAGPVDRSDNLLYRLIAEVQTRLDDQFPVIQANKEPLILIP